MQLDYQMANIIKKLARHCEKCCNNMENESLVRRIAMDHVCPRCGMSSSGRQICARCGAYLGELDFSPGPAAPQEILKKYWGHDAFRPGQKALIDALLSSRDAFGVMPTGAGKSGLLSASCADAQRHGDSRIAFDFPDERSGWRAKADGRARGVSQQRPVCGAISKGAAKCAQRRLQDFIRCAGAPVYV